MLKLNVEFSFLLLMFIVFFIYFILFFFILLNLQAIQYHVTGAVWSQIKNSP